MRSTLDQTCMCWGRAVTKIFASNTCSEFQVSAFIVGAQSPKLAALVARHRYISLHTLWGTRNAASARASHLSVSDHFCLVEKTTKIGLQKMGVLTLVTCCGRVHCTRCRLSAKARAHLHGGCVTLFGREIVYAENSYLIFEVLFHFLQKIFTNIVSS